MMMNAYRLLVTVIVISHVCLSIRAEEDELPASCAQLIEFGANAAFGARLPDLVKVVTGNKILPFKSSKSLEPDLELQPTTPRDDRDDTSFDLATCGDCACAVTAGVGISGAVLGFLALSIMMLAAIAGACAEALTFSTDIHYTNRAAWMVIKSSLAGTFTAIGVSFAAVPLNVIVAIILSRTTSGRESIMNIMNAVAGFGAVALAGYVSSTVAGQDPITGLNCALIYTGLMLPFKMISAAIEDNESKYPMTNLVCSAAPCGAGALALYCTVSNFPNYGAGSLMGLFGNGAFASIVDKLPVPPS